MSPLCSRNARSQKPSLDARSGELIRAIIIGQCTRASLDELSLSLAVALLGTRRISAR
jgi:hypothetical protein